jgi:hypothetical protein
VAEPRRLAALSDAALADALGALSASLAVPSAAPVGSPDLASRARSRIEAEGIAPETGWLDRLGLRPTGRPATRPLRRGLVLALAALLVLAAIAGAIGFGLPGLQIVFGPTPSASPSPSLTVGATPAPTPSRAPTPTPTVGPPGSALGLGRIVSLAEARAAVDFPILLPTDSRIGAPDVVWIDDVDRVTLIWLERPGLTTIVEPGISLIVTEFPGHMDEGYFQKILQGGTTIERVDVAGSVGYWISGDPHQFVYVGPSGEPEFESRRLVGDTLAWSIGDVTYRLETSLGKDDAILVAESMR